MNQPASAYFIEDRHEPNETHTLSVLVQNEPGVLARVIGLDIASNGLAGADLIIQHALPCLIIIAIRLGRVRQQIN